MENVTIEDKNEPADKKPEEEKPVEEKQESPTTDTTSSNDTRTTPMPSTPKMKCAQVQSYMEESGEFDPNTIIFSKTHPKPMVNPQTKSMLVKVMACSISAGDVIILSGKIVFLKPDLPYIPGMDICGVVDEVSPLVTDFKEGDVIVANNGTLPVGGMAEYMLVDATYATKKPSDVDILQAASASSAVTSLHAVDYIQVGDRVLVLGGSGGVGSSAIALAKMAGASFIATTSTQEGMCRDLGADEVIDYRMRHWWDVEDYKQNKFDKIIDTVGGGNFYGKAEHVLKTGSKGGTFIAVTGDEPKPDVSSWVKAITFFGAMPFRPIYTWFLNSSYPKFVTLLPHDEMNGLDKVLNLIDGKKFQIHFDPSSPHSFTEEGIREAFKIQCSGHAHGKVVVRIGF